jgi:hypothetical protein
MQISLINPIKMNLEDGGGYKKLTILLNKNLNKKRIK